MCTPHVPDKSTHTHAPQINHKHNTNTTNTTHLHTHDHHLYHAHLISIQELNINKPTTYSTNRHTKHIPPHIMHTYMSASYVYHTHNTYTKCMMYGLMHTNNHQPINVTKALCVHHHWTINVAKALCVHHHWTINVTKALCVHHNWTINVAKALCVHHHWTINVANALCVHHHWTINVTKALCVHHNWTINVTEGDIRDNLPVASPVSNSICYQRARRRSVKLMSSHRSHRSC